MSRVVQWGQGPLRFQISSSDAVVLSRVATIVASWPADADARLARKWRVEPIDSAPNEPLWDAYVDDEPGTDPALFRRADPVQLMQAIEFDAVRQLLIGPEQILGLHAALVSRPSPAGERGVALIGPCFSGKSTLSCALWRSGWSFLCDDVTLFDEGARAYPAPRRASMRETSRDLIGEGLWTQAAATPASDRTADSLLFHPHEVDGQLRPDHTRLQAIVFLARYNARLAPAELRKLDPVDGAIALLPYSNVRELPFPAALSRMAPLAETVPIYDLGRAPLDAMIARLNRLVDAASES